MRGAETRDGPPLDRARQVQVAGVLPKTPAYLVDPGPEEADPRAAKPILA